MIPRSDKRRSGVTLAEMEAKLNSLDIGNDTWRVEFHEGPIDRDGCTHACYADGNTRVITLDSRLPHKAMLAVAMSAVCLAWQQYAGAGRCRKGKAGKSRQRELRIIELPNVQPGNEPGKTCYGRLEDGILWMYRDTPKDVKRRIIAQARRETRERGEA